MRLFRRLALAFLLIPFAALAQGVGPGGGGTVGPGGPGGGGCTNNCNFTGTTTTAGIADSGGINTTAALGYAVAGVPTINLLSNQSSPVIPPGGQNAFGGAASGYFPGSPIFGFTNAIVATTPNTYTAAITDIATVTGTDPNHWGELLLNLRLSGAGSITGETNLQSNELDIASGVTIDHGENYEASFNNAGVISGPWRGFLTEFVNGAAGTITGEIDGVAPIWANNNATAASWAQWVSLRCQVQNGSGSAPSFNFCLKNTDATAAILTQGNITIGAPLTPAPASVQVQIQGPDLLSTSFPIRVFNSGGTGVFVLRDNGAVSFGGSSTSALSTFGLSGTTSGELQVQSATGANAITLQGGSATGAFLQISGALLTGTPATYACFQANGILVSSATPCV